MTAVAFRWSVGAAIAALVAAGGGAVSIAPAHADAAADKAFIEYLDRKGVPFKNRTEVIRLAKDFCVEQVRQGQPTWVAGYNLSYEQDWTQQQLDDFINGAIPVYCPKLWGM